MPPTGCGCHHGGRYRQSGERYWYGEECQFLCQCNGITGQSHCMASSCGAQDSCRVVDGQYGCHPKPEATCSASGDPHYTSFDRRTFDFQGTCRYVLASVCNGTQGLPHFQVEARNEAWNGLQVSITVAVYVNVSGHLVYISKDNRGTVQVRVKFKLLFRSSSFSFHHGGTSFSTCHLFSSDCLSCLRSLSKDLSRTSFLSNQNKSNYISPCFLLFVVITLVINAEVTLVSY